jgi:hypothetical protein
VKKKINLRRPLGLLFSVSILVKLRSEDEINRAKRGSSAFDLQQKR